MGRLTSRPIPAHFSTILSSGKLSHPLWIGGSVMISLILIAWTQEGLLPVPAERACEDLDSITIY
jgi:hypothetical protein